MSVFPQNRPIRVKFPKGSTSVTLKGTLHSANQQIYLVHAREWQTLSVTLKPNEGEQATFFVKLPDGTLQDCGYDDDLGFFYSAPVEQSGDYQIVVTTPGEVEDENFSTNYRLKISIYKDEG